MKKLLCIILLFCTALLVPALSAKQPINKKQQSVKKIAYIIGGIKAGLGTVSCLATIYFLNKTMGYIITHQDIHKIGLGVPEALLTATPELADNFKALSPEQQAATKNAIYQEALTINSKKIFFNSIGTLSTGILGIALMADGLRDIYKTYKQK